MAKFLYGKMIHPHPIKLPLLISLLLLPLFIFAQNQSSNDLIKEKCDNVRKRHMINTGNDNIKWDGYFIMQCGDDPPHEAFGIDPTRQFITVDCEYDKELMVCNSDERNPSACNAARSETSVANCSTKGAQKEGWTDMPENIVLCPGYGNAWCHSWSSASLNEMCPNNALLTCKTLDWGDSVEDAVYTPGTHNGTVRIFYPPPTQDESAPYPTEDALETSSTITTPIEGAEETGEIICPDGRESIPGTFCGRGLNRRDCDEGQFCFIDPTDRFAVCCLEPLVTYTPASLDEAKCCDSLEGPGGCPGGCCPDAFGSFDRCWDEGGYCCSDGKWYADNGAGGNNCQDNGLMDSMPCTTSVPSQAPTSTIISSSEPTLLVSSSPSPESTSSASSQSTPFVLSFLMVTFVALTIYV